MFTVKIKIREISKGCMPEVIKQGDWIDLRSTVTLHAPAPSIDENGIHTVSSYIPLGIAMQLPKGYEAIVAPRSSSFKKYGFIVPNSIGVIDNSYNGNTDQWMCPALFLKEGDIQYGDRICQFRIQLSQKATMWQKIKWLLGSKIKFEKVDVLPNVNRGGFGKGTKNIK